MDDPAHAHQWHERYRSDGCHLIRVVRECACGAYESTYEERDFSGDPMAVAFADEDCGRCRELLAGAEPASWGATR